MKGPTLSTPPSDAHVAPCGLFCTTCGKFRRGRCKGCQIEPGFRQCPVRRCCAEKGITICSQCADFAAPRDYRACRKVNNFIARAISLVTGSDRSAALALLRDRGLAAYLAAQRAPRR